MEGKVKLNNKIILAIETSCDDTSIAIFNNDKLLSLYALSTLKEFRKWGGIVPEIAARGHEGALYEVCSKAIEMSGIKINDITHIAYTAEPGLPGSLHVGKVFAKTLAYSLDVPLVPVNHMLGHVFSYAIGDAQQIKFPFICLVASGGHTSLYKFTSAIDYEILNETADDAIGEALDKIGRMLNLEYPGGVSIDKQYNPSRTNYKLIDHRAPNEPFSFSGLKTHILNEINICKMKNKQIDVELLASSTLKWVIDDVMGKIKYYATANDISRIVIGGGVAANSLLRKVLTESEYEWKIPELKYCGDNGAMIGFYAYLLIK